MNALILAVALGIAAVAAARGTWSPCGLSMVSAINPTAEHARGNRYWVTVCWYVLGAVVGGAGLAASSMVLSLLATPLRDRAAAACAVGAVACLVAVAADLRLGGFTLPGHPRQVNELWLTRYRRWIYASGYGVQIGFGFATYIMTAAVYLTVVLAALAGSPRWAFVVGVTFGVVRGLAVLLTARARRLDQLYRLHARLEALAPVSVRAVVLAECAAAVALAAGAGGLAGALVLTAALAGGWVLHARGRVSAPGLASPAVW